MSGGEIVDRVAVRVHELEQHLDDFGDRLRTMRRRNRDLEQEMQGFEQEIEKLRAWLSEQVEEGR